MKFQIGVYFLLIPFCYGRISERIKELGAAGRGVVDDVVNELFSKRIFQNKGLLQKLATIRSNDGVPFKSRNGGIWRVDLNQLATVKTSCQEKLHQLCKSLEEQFNVDVQSMTVADLDKPLYSGAVMSLLLSSINSTFPTKSIRGEKFWEKFVSKTISEHMKGILTPDVYTKDNLLYKQYLKTLCRERTDGVHAKTLPHPNPRLYIQCLKSSDYYVKRCPWGTFWVQKKQTCAHRLGSSSKDKEKKVTKNKMVPTKEKFIEKAFDNPCTKESLDNGKLFFPHTDHSKYVQCTKNGSFIIKQCNPGSYWFQNESMCHNSSEHLHRYRSMIFKTTLHGNGGSTTLNPLLNIFKHLCTKAAIDSKHIYYSHPDARKFVVCTGVGLYIIRSCTSGKLWSKKGDICIKTYYPSTPYLPSRHFLTNIYKSTRYSTATQSYIMSTHPARNPKRYPTRHLSYTSQISSYFVTSGSHPKSKENSRYLLPGMSIFTTFKTPPLTTSFIKDSQTILLKKNTHNNRARDNIADGIQVTKSLPTYHPGRPDEFSTISMNDFNKGIAVTRETELDQRFKKFDKSFCTQENIVKGLKYYAHRYPTMYFQCIGPGSYVIRNCPKSFFWSRSEMKCITAKVTMPQTTPTMTTLMFLSSPVDQETTKIPLPNDFKNPCTKDVLATKKFLFPHPNPRMFIQCSSNGTYKVKKCGNNAVWLAPNNTCIYMPTEETTKIPKTTSFKISAKRGTVKRASANAFENYCTRENLETNRRFFPHPEPNKFIQCTQPGSYIIKECHNQSSWSQEKFSCISNIETNTYQSEASTTFKTTTFKTTLPVSTVTAYSPSLLNKIKNPCTREKIAANVMFFAHPDAKYYVQCTTHGTYYVKSCDNGTLWSQANQTCIHSYTHHSIIQREHGGMNTGKSLCTAEALEAGTGYFAHSDPRKFIQCTVPGSYVLRDCSPGTVWDQEKMDCVFGASIHYELSSGIPETTHNKEEKEEKTWDETHEENPCTRDLFKARFSHPDPTKYIQCSDWYNFITMKCTPGKVWSQQLYNCI
ncbi:uncharacterized protein LOC115215561 [Argonauta hians]